MAAHGKRAAANCGPRKRHALDEGAPRRAVKKHPTRLKEDQQSPWQDWPIHRRAGGIATRDEAARLARGRTTQKPVGSFRRRSRTFRLAAGHARFTRVVPAGKGLSDSQSRATDSRKNQRHAERIAKTASGDERRRPTRQHHRSQGSCHKRRDPRTGNTAKGQTNPMNVAGPKMTRSGPVVPGSGAKVAERRAKERPRRMTRSGRREP
jgi:hypothetical protein